MCFFFDHAFNSFHFHPHLSADGVDPDIGEEGKELIIIKASYGPGGWTDATDAVQAAVADGKFNADGGVHTVLGDPAPGVGKHFICLYRIA